MFWCKRAFFGRSGNVALSFALLAPVLVLVAGVGIDISDVAMRQSQLQQAADAAAVGAVSRGSPGYLYAVNNMTSTGPVPDSVTSASTQALFNANWNNPKDTTTPVITGYACSTPPQVSTLVCKQTTPLSALTVNSALTATATLTPSFLGLVGQKTIKLTASAHASDNIPVYMNFYLLLDNTPSMGIAATTAGIQTMVNSTTDQCAFACHDLSNSNNYYNLAKQLGVNTRIYNVAQAASNLLKTAQNTETANGIANEFSTAVYDFGATATDPTASTYVGYNQVYPTQAGTVTTNLSGAATAAAGIDLMTVQGQNQFNDIDTNLGDPLNFAAQNLTASGNGTSASAPQQVLFFVSDGVNDAYNCSYNNGNSCRQITPLDPTPCTTLKKNGIKIAVLYTTYLPLPTNSFWTSWVQPYTTPTDQVAANMQSCASPGLYFEVNSSQDINAAMHALFEKVVASVKIDS